MLKVVVCCVHKFHICRVVNKLVGETWCLEVSVPSVVGRLALSLNPPGGSVRGVRGFSAKRVVRKWDWFLRSLPVPIVGLS